MREQTFTLKHQERWERLETLLNRAGKSGIRSLAAADLRELALLYRAATTDLAAAQSRTYSRDLLQYLNRLTARAYAIVYAGSARSGWSPLAEFFTRTFPCEIRRSSSIIVATTALFAVAAIVAYWLVSVRTTNVYALLPADEIPTISGKLHDTNFGFDRTFALAMSSRIITNNIKVAMLAFAGGMTLGVLTVWEILNNGLMVGTLAALFAQAGYGMDFWATIAPHGVIELTSIQISAAAGLLLAQAIVAPGRLRRSDALKVNGRRAGVLMIGVAGLLVLAGTIEGFITPQRISETLRIGVGAVTAALLAIYIVFAGRGLPMPDTP